MWLAEKDDAAPVNDAMTEVVPAAHVVAAANDGAVGLVPTTSMVLGCIGVPSSLDADRGAEELAKLRADRQRLFELRSYLEWLEWTVRSREREIIGLIDSGVEVEGARVVTRRRQSISWLSIVERELGRAKVLQVKDSWPVAFYKELQLT